ncbi:MAG: ABC transporter transmembrane domain-containing protein, partial [Lacrimispora sphenoides]
MSEQRTNRKPMAGGPMGQGAVEKPKDFKKTWGKLIAYCKNYMPAVIAALVMAAIGTVLQIIGPDKLKDMTNEIMKGLPSLLNGVPVAGAIDFGIVKSIALLLVALYTGSALLNFIQSFMMATVTQKISKNMRTGISQKINKLPLKYFDRVSYGDILSRVTNDVDTIGQSMNQSIGNL